MNICKGTYMCVSIYTYIHVYIRIYLCFQKLALLFIHTYIHLYIYLPEGMYIMHTQGLMSDFIYNIYIYLCIHI